MYIGWMWKEWSRVDAVIIVVIVVIVSLLVVIVSFGTVFIMKSIFSKVDDGKMSSPNMPDGYVEQVPQDSARSSTVSTGT